MIIFFPGVISVKTFDQWKTSIPTHRTMIEMITLATDKSEDTLDQGEFSKRHLLRYRNLFENTSFKPRCLSCFCEVKQQKEIVSPSVAAHTCGGQIQLKNLNFIEVESEAMRVDYPWER